VIAAGFQLTTQFSADVGFRWPNRYSTDYICSFNWFSNGFQHWFVVGSLNRLNRFSAGCVGSFSTGFQLVVKQVFN